MDTIVFLPGIMGSVLKNVAGKIVWPPTIGEAISGIDDPERLLEPSLTPTDVIRRVCIKDFYRPLIADLKAIGYEERGDGAKRLVCHPYDWRNDLFGEAEVLARRLDELHAAGASPIRLLGHSMGGLVIRLLLEKGDWASRPWFLSVEAAIFLATPHRGSPQGLVRLLGLGGSTAGLSASAIKKLANDPRYPAVYQLLPPPGDIICWDSKSQPLDIYNPEVVGQLYLSADGLERARALHSTIDFNKRPPNTRYFLFAGTGMETAIRVELAPGRIIVQAGVDAGDGTVPLWSSADGKYQRHAAPGEHTAVFTSRSIREVFYRLLGSELVQTFVAGATPEAVLVVRDIVLDPSKPQPVLIVPEVPVSNLDAELVLERSSTGDPANFVPAVAPMALLYRGTALSQLQLQIPGEKLVEPGIYQLTLRGNVVSKEPASFVVQAS